MILQSLCKYYDRLKSETDLDIPEPGWANTGVTSCIIIDVEGEVVSVISMLDSSGKKPKPQQMLVPLQPKRSGRKPKPAFLCEKSEFIFGIYKDKEYAEYRFDASKEIHEKVLSECGDAGAKALLKFFNKRKMGDYTHYDVDVSPLEDGGNIIFALEDDNCFLHERPLIKKAWAIYNSKNSENAEIGQCLVTGEIAPIARLHGNFSGFGADKPTLVGFNQSAFTSYNKKQGSNAPVSENAAFKYVTALNYLIKDNNHTLNIHEDKVIFWAERSAPKEERGVSLLFEPGLLENDSLIDSDLAASIKSIFYSIKQGKKPVNRDFDEKVKFDILGVSTNKTRMVIRFFYTNTFGELTEKILNHYQDIYIDGNHGREFPSPYILVREAALMRENKNIPPNVESELIRSILYGMPYPYGLYCEMLSRIRAEVGGDSKRNRGFAISRERAGFIKGYINRNSRFMNKNEKEMMNVSLDDQQTNVGYVLGRLFALLEKTQKDALGKVNASIVDKYMNTALATPQYVFPMLLTLSKKHISKIGKQTAYDTPYIEMQIGKVIDMLPAAGFPKSLNIEDQGRFVVGYYHQNQVLYESKKDKEE